MAAEELVLEKKLDKGPISKVVVFLGSDTSTSPGETLRISDIFSNEEIDEVRLIVFLPELFFVSLVHTSTSVSGSKSKIEHQPVFNRAGAGALNFAIGTKRFYGEISNVLQNIGRSFDKKIKSLGAKIEKPKKKEYKALESFVYKSKELVKSLYSIARGCYEVAETKYRGYFILKMPNYKGDLEKIFWKTFRSYPTMRVITKKEGKGLAPLIEEHIDSIAEAFHSLLKDLTNPLEIDVVNIHDHFVYSSQYSSLARMSLSPKEIASLPSERYELRLVSLVYGGGKKRALALVSIPILAIKKLPERLDFVSPYEYRRRTNLSVLFNGTSSTEIRTGVFLDSYIKFSSQLTKEFFEKMLGRSWPFWEVRSLVDFEITNTNGDATVFFNPYKGKKRFEEDISEVEKLYQDDPYTFANIAQKINTHYKVPPVEWIYKIYEFLQEKNSDFVYTPEHYLLPIVISNSFQITTCLKDSSGSVEVIRLGVFPETSGVKVGRYEEFVYKLFKNCKIIIDSFFNPIYFSPEEQELFIKMLKDDMMYLEMLYELSIGVIKIGDSVSTIIKETTKEGGAGIVLKEKDWVALFLRGK